ncbi:MAG: 50S ribosomal protein L10 [Anaerolineaceae bacterium]|nr:50S ribosomal protein L10 [Anaerolineaceae bacterium]
MAFTKTEKEAMLQRYEEWLEKSKGVFVLSYSKMHMPAVNTARARLREADGTLHVVKNRIFAKALENKGFKIEPGFWENNNVVVFAFEDAPSVAKGLAEIVKSNQAFEVRGGYLDKSDLSVKQVKDLADLPTLPVMRATFLGLLQTPASKLVRTLAEPARGLAAVIKANSEKQPAAA